MKRSDGAGGSPGGEAEVMDKRLCKDTTCCTTTGRLSQLLAVQEEVFRYFTEVDKHTAIRKPKK